MDFDLIIEQITNGLTGDFETDFAYIKEQMNKYKDHELSQEILRACGRIMYEIMPEEKKSKLKDAMKNDDLRIDSTLDEVRFNIFKKDFSKAENIMAALVKNVDELAESGMFQDDAVSAYFNFKEPFEDILYISMHKPEKEVRHAEIPYSDVYLQYGSLLVDLKRYKEANAALAKAVRWNPVNAKIAFEYAETFKLMGDIDKFFEISKDVFKFAFKPNDVARCYRNIAYYFVEKELWAEAIGCNLMSLQFEEESKNAQSELYYIHEVTNGKIEDPTVEELKAFGEQYGFPIGADKDILGIAYMYGKHCLEGQQLDAARYFFTILYNLTNDESIKEILDQLPLETEVEN